MGWCSGTQIFDPVVGALLNGDSKEAIIRVLVEVLEDEDWDCQSDSAYIDDPIVAKIMKDLHPDWQD